MAVSYSMPVTIECHAADILDIVSSAFASFTQNVVASSEKRMPVRCARSCIILLLFDNFIVRRPPFSSDSARWGTFLCCWLRYLIMPVHWLKNGWHHHLLVTEEGYVCLRVGGHCLLRHRQGKVQLLRWKLQCLLNSGGNWAGSTALIKFLMLSILDCLAEKLDGMAHQALRMQWVVHQQCSDLTRHRYFVISFYEAAVFYDASLSTCRRHLIM